MCVALDILQIKVLLASNYMEDMGKVIIDTYDRSKRHLPKWMQSNNTSKNESLGNSDELCSTSGKQIEARDGVSMIKSMSSEVDVVLDEKKKDSENKETFARNYSKKNIRKPKRDDDSKDSTSNSSGTKRKFEGEVIKHGKSIDTQHMKLKSAKRNNEKVLLTEDEAELTVEDLISIAQEFLTSNKEILSFISQTERSCEVLSKCTQNSTYHLNNFDQKQTEESAASKIIQSDSGDAAQDMLKLFLGPLLKNAPPLKEQLLTSTYDEKEEQLKG